MNKKIIIKGILIGLALALIPEAIYNLYIFLFSRLLPPETTYSLPLGLIEFIFEAIRFIGRPFSSVIRAISTSSYTIRRMFYGFFYLQYLLLDIVCWITVAIMILKNKRKSSNQEIKQHNEALVAERKTFERFKLVALINLILDTLTISFKWWFISNLEVVGTMIVVEAMGAFLGISVLIAMIAFVIHLYRVTHILYTQNLSLHPLVWVILAIFGSFYQIIIVIIIVIMLRKTNVYVREKTKGGEKA